MMRAILIAGASLALGTFGCGKKTTSFHHCASDSDCGSTQVCFPDGCGDPTQGLRVEVTPNARDGLYAEDFVIGTQANKQDFTLPGPSIISGDLSQQNGQGVMPYSGLVSIQALGESTLIPGVIRSFQLSSARGNYQLPVASGTYSLSANPTEEPLPPLQLDTKVVVAPGDSVVVPVVFPSSVSLSQLSGRLLIGGQPPASALAVQALDPNTQRPLSQRATSDAEGNFQLQVAPAVQNVLVQSFPINVDADIPRKTFSVALPTQPVTLELGVFGSAFEISGRLRTSNGDPVAGATVYIDGPVLGGGTFRSRSVVTSSTGAFTLRTLATPPDRPATLRAFAPPESPCGLLSVAVIVLGPGSVGTLACPEKVQVKGSVVLANGAQAAGVAVAAQPIAAIRGQPLPSSVARATTDNTGTYTLYVDPAVYRLDFAPHGQLPRSSRFVTIVGDPADSGFKPVEIEPLALSNGRRLTGTLYFAPTAGANSPVAGVASVRFFRLSTDTSAPASVLLAETVSDPSGSYSAILPAR